MNCLSCGSPVPLDVFRCPTCKAAVRIPTADAYADLIADRTADFTGREWVFKQLDTWLEPGGSPMLLLTGRPGTGKTAVVARLVQMSHGSVPAEGYPHLGRSSLTFVHFCQVADPTSRDPRRFVERLSTTLARLYEPFARALIQGSSRQIIVHQSVGRAEAGSQVTSGAFQKFLGYN